MNDEFGGVLIEQSDRDEFGGIAVDEEYQSPFSEETRRRFPAPLKEPSYQMGGIPLTTTSAPREGLGFSDFSYLPDGRRAAEEEASIRAEALRSLPRSDQNPQLAGIREQMAQDILSGAGVESLTLPPGQLPEVSAQTLESYGLPPFLAKTQAGGQQAVARLLSGIVGSPEGALFLAAPAAAPAMMAAIAPQMAKHGAEEIGTGLGEIIHGDLESGIARTGTGVGMVAPLGLPFLPKRSVARTETKPTPEVSDALQQEAARPVRDLREQPVESQAQVPAQESRPAPVEARQEIAPKDPPPPPTGERLVEVQRPDGTKYTAAFGDKTYEGFGPDPIPSVARWIPPSEGKPGGWSHGLLGKGEKIVERASPSPEPETIGPGPGAKTASEPDPSIIASLKKEAMAKDRERLNLPPQDPALRYTNQQALDNALVRMENDPGWVDSILKEVERKPRPLLPDEVAGVTARYSGIKTEYERAMRDWKDAFEGNDFARAAELGELMDRWRGEMDTLHDITGRGGTGTEAGRALQALKLALDEEFRLVRMDTEARQAKGGELTPQERNRIVELNKQIEELQKQLEESRASEGQATRRQSSSEAYDEVAGEVRQRKAKKTPTDPAAEKSELIQTIQRRFHIEGDSLVDLQPYIKRLARALMEEKFRGREELIDALHAELKPAMPELTRTEVQDAFSRYGDFQPFTGDEITTKLAQYSQETQKVRALEDMAQKVAPKKTGRGRVEASDEYRRLIKEVNEAKKKGGFIVTDPAQQLRTALETTKTRLRNQIADLDHEITTRQKIVREKGPSPTDAEIDALKARRDELKAQRDEIFGDPEMSPERRLEIAIAAAERSEAAWIERLEKAKRGIFEDGKPPSKVPPSAALDAIKARREALKDEVQSLRDLAFPKKTKEEIAIQIWRTRVSNQIADLNERLARGDFEPRKRQKFEPSSPEDIQLQADLEGKRNEFYRTLHELRLSQRSKAQKVWDGIKQTPRMTVNLASSFDFSAPRQALPALLSALTRPQAGRALLVNPFANMFKGWSSENRARLIDQQIKNRPNAKSGADKAAGIEYSELETNRFSRREENAYSILDDWARMPLKPTNLSGVATAVPKGIARGVRASNRAFITFLNSTRASLFDELLRTNFKDRPPTDVELKAVGGLVNLMTGRGNLNPKTASVASGVIWSPNLLASRVKLASGTPLVTAPTAATRALVAKEYARMLIGGYLLSQIASIFDEKDAAPMTSSDVGKVVRGNTRIDPWGGFQQVTTLAARAGSGKTTTLKGQERPSDLGQLILNFGRSKIRPDWGALWNAYDVIYDQTKPGHPETLGAVAAETAIPLSLRDVVKVMQEHGFTEGMIIQALSQFGAGVSVHEDIQRQK